MSPVIKAAAAGDERLHVRPLPAGPLPEMAATEQVVSVEVLALRRQLESAARDLDQKSQEVERLREDVSRAFHEGEAEGRRLGLQEANDSRDHALSLLRGGLEAAHDGLTARFASLEELATAIAYAAIEKIFDRPDQHQMLVGSAIRRQLADIEGQSVLWIAVSRQDFPDEADLSQLCEALGRTGVDLRASADLAAGECQIKLSLGVLEIGLTQQRERLGLVLQGQSSIGVAA